LTESVDESSVPLVRRLLGDYAQGTIEFSPSVSFEDRKRVQNAFPEAEVDFESKGWGKGFF
jgi:hypothetical protein